MKGLSIFILVGLIFSGHTIAGTENNPDRWPSFTLDGIYTTFDGNVSFPALHGDLFSTSKGHQAGFESLIKVPIASRITLRAGVGYLQHIMDNTILGETNMTKDDYRGVRYQLGFTIYLAGSK